MGNSSSSSARGPQDETVDFGHLLPQGVYTGPRDWNHAIVTQLICQRRLAPFYRPLEDYEDSWTDEQILAARKELPDAENSTDGARSDSPSMMSSNSTTSKTSHNKRSNSLKEPSRPEATIYRGAVECPICFLYYPPNINHSRCCAQAICTECFVQIKRSEPTTTHLVSEPAACPYCVQDNFGIVYSPPPWRAGIGSEGSSSISSDSPKGSQNPVPTSSTRNTHKKRQKSFSADSPEVVTIDHIRPDWEAKLAAVRAAVARRANRRIIMRQVGDRLIPVGVTSGRVHALPDEAGGEPAEGSGSRRSRRRQQNPGNPFEQYLGQDLEEATMRLSLLEHEEQQRKEAEEKKKKEKDKKRKPEPGGADTEGGPSTAGPSLSPNLHPPITLTSTPSSSSSTGPNQDSLQAQPNSDPTGSRSPSPAPNSRDNTSNGLTHTNSMSNPPPFSTLAAAMSTTSTASALLASHSHDSSAGASPSTADVQDGNSNGTNAAEEPPRRPDVSHTDTSESVASTLGPQTPGSYQELPSSPETTFQQPLIAKKTPAEGEDHAEYVV
ncbi:SNF1-interacting protein [Marasmius tenuissimus]|uniref:SNF1-interacting protein n=1 Tax=Marasmius tenuissimus TaxID=585030 RepID=A0ABR3ADA3_9AGAR